MTFRKGNRKGKDPNAPPAEEGLSKVASIADTPPDAVKKLLAEIDGLKAQLKVEKAARGEAEQAALDAAQAQGSLLQSDVQEVPSGKRIKVQRLDHYKVVGHKDDGREIIKAVMKTVEIPTFFYKVDMPPCGGTDLKINGIPYYHGTVYELDLDTLRTIKEMVYRTWDHDRNVHASDENFYRKKQSPTLSARGLR